MTHATWEFRSHRFIRIHKILRARNQKNVDLCCWDGQGYEVSEVVQVVQVVHVTKFVSEIGKSGTSLQILIPTAAGRGRFSFDVLLATASF